MGRRAHYLCDLGLIEYNADGTGYAVGFGTPDLGPLD
jgi:hypothetical protein